MKKLLPINSTTLIIDKHTWRPDNFSSVFKEINHIKNENSNVKYLYRGHKFSHWLLDSTFVRYYKENILQVPVHKNITDSIKNSEEFYNAITWFYLLKFGILSKPSNELEKLEKTDKTDSWFELMKRMQQYPKEDHPTIQGTNIIDWTKSLDIAIFFANNARNSDGAIWICDYSKLGKILQTIFVSSILDKMKNSLKLGKATGCPLLFHPKNQINNKRANNQEAIYFAQMDLRYPLDELWEDIEKKKENKNELLFMKIILPANSVKDFNIYLAEKRITPKFIYPDT